MAITEKDVAHIARLARLFITQDETKRYQQQLGKILESMDELKSLDTSKVQPTSNVLGLTDVLREDSVKAFNNTEKLLEGAPDREGPYFKVQKVIE